MSNEWFYEIRDYFLLAVNELKMQLLHHLQIPVVKEYPMIFSSKIPYPYYVDLEAPSYVSGN